MKTLMKKLLILLAMTTFVAFALPLFVNAFAVQNELDYEIGENHYTVIFEGELSEGKKDIIAKRILGIEVETAEPYGLMCTLFGHNYEETTAVIITHKARTSAPRCKREIYQVKVCSRCDDTVYTLDTRDYIYCCSAD